MAAAIELAGRRFGLLTALKRDPGAKPARYAVRCDCGVEKSVRADHLRERKVISCGCEHRRRAKERASNLDAYRTTHGASKTPAYSVWHGMKGRCENPNDPAFDRYGARGIKMCDRWQNFSNFLADMGQPPIGLTIERENNDGPYEPSNCRWATRKEQQNNRSCNRSYTLNGRTQNLTQWAAEAGLSRNTVDQRLSSGISIEDALKKVEPNALAKAAASVRMAKSHCKHGHEYTPENTGRQGNGGRFCRKCHTAKTRRQREAKAAN